MRMAKYPRLTEAEINEAIGQTEKAIEAGKDYLKFLSTGQGLPRDLESRQQLAESHTKLIAKLEKIVDDLETELATRTKAAKP
jgi:type II secretory pathway component PulF